MRIANLDAVFTGAGFRKNEGRRPSFADADCVLGPVDIVCDANGKITFIESTKKMTHATVDGTGLVATASFTDSHTHALFGGDRSHEFFCAGRAKATKTFRPRVGAFTIR